MSMDGLWLDTMEATCERYAIGEMGFDEAIQKLRGMGLCQDEAMNHLDAACDEREELVGQ